MLYETKIIHILECKEDPYVMYEGKAKTETGIKRVVKNSLKRFANVPEVVYINVYYDFGGMKTIEYNTRTGKLTD